MTTDPVRAYRIVTTAADGEEWADEAAAADAAVARQLSIAPREVEALRRRVNVDPVVVRRDGFRWRSRQVWNVRSATGTVRVYEMLRIDEAVYDH